MTPSGVRAASRATSPALPDRSYAAIASAALRPVAEARAVPSTPVRAAQSPGSAAAALPSGWPAAGRVSGRRTGIARREVPPVPPGAVR